MELGCLIDLCSHQTDQSSYPDLSLYVQDYSWKNCSKKRGDALLIYKARKKFLDGTDKIDSSLNSWPSCTADILMHVEPHRPNKLCPNWDQPGRLNARAAGHFPVIGCFDIMSCSQDAPCKQILSDHRLIMVGFCKN